MAQLEMEYQVNQKGDNAGPRRMHLHKTTCYDSDVAVPKGFMCCKLSPYSGDVEKMLRPSSSEPREKEVIGNTVLRRVQSSSHGTLLSLPLLSLLPPTCHMTLLCTCTPTMMPMAIPPAPMCMGDRGALASTKAILLRLPAYKTVLLNKPLLFVSFQASHS